MSNIQSHIKDGGTCIAVSKAVEVELHKLLGVQSFPQQAENTRNGTLRCNVCLASLQPLRSDLVVFLYAMPLFTYFEYCFFVPVLMLYLCISFSLLYKGSGFHMS